MIRVDESNYGIDLNAGYRYYDKFKNDGSATRISFIDEIDPAYFADVIGFGVDHAIETLNIPLANEVFLNNTGMWLFNDDEEFKVTWDFESKRTDFKYRKLVSSLLKIEYMKDNTLVDEAHIADFTTYEQALDFIMDYVQKYI